VLSTGWEEATAIGTIAAAVMTAWLAWSTRKLARETSAQMQAEWQPILMPDVEQATDGAIRGTRLENRLFWMDVRNVGRGPALTVTATLEDDDGKVLRGRARSNVVAPNVSTTLEWKDFDPPKPPQTSSLNTWARLNGVITYGDVGSVPHGTEITVDFRTDGAVYVRAQYLGSGRDILTRGDLARGRALSWMLSLAAHLPPRLQGWARRLALKRFYPSD